VDCATLVQPNATHGLDNSYQCDGANLYSPRTVAVRIPHPAATDAADKLSYWVNERGMNGVRLQSQSQAEPDDPRRDDLRRLAEDLGVLTSIGGGGQPEKVDRMRKAAARHPPSHHVGLQFPVLAR
jgi:predicted TIM-barrel fold metal-dependent hydrolase